MYKFKQILPSITVIALLMLSTCLFSRMDTKELERRLPGSTGKERIEILTELASNYSFSEPKKAKAFAEEARASMRKVSHPEYEARLLIVFSSIHLFLGEFAEAENYALRSVQKAQVSGNKKDYAEALYLIGLINWRRGMYPRVPEPLNLSLELFKEIGHLRGTAKTYNVLGMLYWKTNEPSRALEYYGKAGKIYEETGYKQGIAIIYTNSGIIHMDMGNLDNALEFYQKALEIQKELNNKTGIETVRNNMAAVYEEQKKLIFFFFLFRPFCGIIVL